MPLPRAPTSGLCSTKESVAVHRCCHPRTLVAPMGFWSDMAVDAESCTRAEARRRANPKEDSRAHSRKCAGWKPARRRGGRRSASLCDPPSAEAPGRGVAARVRRASRPGESVLDALRATASCSGMWPGGVTAPEGAADPAQLDVAIRIRRSAVVKPEPHHQTDGPRRSVSQMIRSARQPCGCRTHKSGLHTAPERTRLPRESRTPPALHPVHSSHGLLPGVSASDLELHDDPCHTNPRVRTTA